MPGKSGVCIPTGAGFYFFFSTPKHPDRLWGSPILQRILFLFSTI